MENTENNQTGTTERNTLVDYAELQFLPSECAVLLDYTKEDAVEFKKQCAEGKGKKFREWTIGRLRGELRSRRTIQILIERNDCLHAHKIFEGYIETLNTDTNGLIAPW